MLHTVNQSPFTSSTLESCLRFVLPGDPILLLEDGVYAAAEGTAKANLITNVLRTNPVYAIRADLKARAIGHTIAGVKVVGYDVFVDLVEAHKTHTWL